MGRNKTLHSPARQFEWTVRWPLRLREGFSEKSKHIVVRLFGAAFIVLERHTFFRQASPGDAGCFVATLMMEPPFTSEKQQFLGVVTGGKLTGWRASGLSNR